VSRLLHNIPVGGIEPIHRADVSCWCHPLLIETQIMVHHAKDLREVKERKGTEADHQLWVIIEQITK
jgi:hypothetical protein